MPAICLTMDGILNVNKASGWTSHDVVAKVRGLLHGQKVGHAGTLDPAATGVLPVLVGRATRIAEQLQGWDKSYRAVLRLGETTDTLDATGTVLQRYPVDGLTETAIREAVSRFQGTTTQVPPMYSAVKVAGVPLYRSARAGRTVERAARPVTVESIEITAIEGANVGLEISCSKGTYVRTLCADIGEALGVGGHLLSLVRTRVGPLHLSDAMTVEEFGARLSAGTVDEVLWPLDAALQHLPVMDVDEPAARRVVHGVAVPMPPDPGWARSAIVRLKDGAGRLIALGQSGDGVIRIQRVLIDAERYGKEIN